MLQSQGMVKFSCIFQLKLTKLNSDVYCERLSISLTEALNWKIRKKVLVQLFKTQHGKLRKTVLLSAFRDLHRYHGNVLNSSRTINLHAT